MLNVDFDLHGQVELDGFSLAVRRRRRAAAADISLTPPPTECRRRAGAVTCSCYVVHQLYVARFL